MGKAEHTPGPWIIGADIPDDLKPLHDIPHGCVSIDSLTRIDRQLGRYGLAFVTTITEGMPDDAGFANALLIAAAPDMLAALKVALTELRTARCCMTESSFDDCWDVQQIRSAIAKATGPTS